MEPYYPQQRDLFAGEQRALPNATAVLVLGILSIVFCFICGIIALVIAGNDKRLYQQQPHLYTSASYELLKAGRICSIIGLCISIVGILFFILFFAFTVSLSSVIN